MWSLRVNMPNNLDSEVIEPIFERYTDQIMPYYEQQKAMIKKQSSRESIQTFVCGGPTHNKRVKQLLESRISAIRFLPERSLVVQGLLDWDGVPMKGVAATSLGFECQWPSKSSWHLGEQPPSTDIVAFPRLKVCLGPYGATPMLMIYRAMPTTNDAP